MEMVRKVQDREDILREATALVSRAECSVLGFDENVIFGFRQDGSIAIYVGPDPVYQFNSQCQLRRVYRNEILLKAKNGRLVELERRLDKRAVSWAERELSDEQTTTLLFELRRHLDDLFEALSADRFKLLAQVPQDDDVVSRLLGWLAALPEQLVVARSPHTR